MVTGAPRGRKRKAEDGKQVKAPALGHAAIAATLGMEILSGKRKPGSRLPSPAEAYTRFGVSRIVLREVSKTLAAKGMVRFKTRIGTLVQEPSSWNWLDADVLAWRMTLGLDDALLRQIAQVRHAVEPAAAEMAARCASRADIARIQAAIKGMQAAVGDRVLFAQADLAFHVAVSAASGNPLFRSFTSVVDVAMSGFLSVITPAAVSDGKVYTRSIALHAKVADAIAARDAAGARRAMLRVVDVGTREVQTLRKARRR